jgi:predicted permease
MRAAHLYRVLLRCYPAQFRHEYSTEMVGVFSAQLREAQRRGDRLAEASVWAWSLLDLVPSALREHRHVLQQDLRQAIRVFIANPGFTAVAVLSLALGIGANSAIFSLLNSVLLRALPVRAPHELVMLSDPASQGVATGSSGGVRALLTYEEFTQLQARSRDPVVGETFTSMMASSSSLFSTDARVAGGERETIAVRLVSNSYFATLGVPAYAGRTFDADEPARGAAPFAVISYDYWQRRLGGRADALGQSIAFPGGAISIIGIAPASFLGETVGERPDAWIPLVMQPLVIRNRDYLHDPPEKVEKTMWLQVFARLRPDVGRARAEAQANVVFAQGLAAYYGAGVSNPTTRQQFLDQQLKLRDAATGASSVRNTFSEPLYVLFGAAALVLLIACANLGNLLLARTTARQREMAVRLALGASRARLVRQLLTESLCLAAAGGVVGLAAAILMRQGLLQLVSRTIALPVAFDARVALFVVGLTLVAGLLVGLLPALRITRAQATVSLREQGRGIAGSAAWLRIGRLVVVGQLALSLPLLGGAGLLARTLVNLQQANVGYQKDRLLTVRVDALAAGYTPERQALALDSLLSRIRALPGVGAATYSNNGLFVGSDNGDDVEVEGYTRTGQGDRGSRYDQVGPGYFSTLGVPLLRGREITDQDRAGQRVCVINESFARRFFKGRDPIGQHATLIYGEQRNTYEVVGVVGDMRANQLRGVIEHRLYVPAATPAASIAGVSFMIRPAGAGSGATAATGDGAGAVAGPGAGLLRDVRRVIEQAEPSMRVSRPRSIAEALDERVAQDRMLAQLSVAFAIVAVLLTAIGLYGVLSYGVTRRTNEIGIRKALGARQTTLILMMLRETGWLVAAGLVAGTALSFLALRAIASRLYGLSPGDPFTFASAVVGLVVVAALATWVPARRASRVDPLIALRQE